MGIFDRFRLENLSIRETDPWKLEDIIEIVNQTELIMAHDKLPSEIRLAKLKDGRYLVAPFYLKNAGEIVGVTNPTSVPQWVSQDTRSYKSPAEREWWFLKARVFMNREEALEHLKFITDKYVDYAKINPSTYPSVE